MEVLTLLSISAGSLIASYEALRILLTSLNKISFVGARIGLFGQNADPSMDMLSAVFTLVISVVSISVIIYTRGYMERFNHIKAPVQISLHYCCLSLLFFSMLGVVNMQGGYSFLFSWELMTMSSFILSLFHAENREIRRAAIYFLMWMHVSFVLLLAGFIIASGGNSSEWGFGYLAEYFHDNKPILVFVLFFMGFGMKAGIFPLHLWLPEIDPAAPSHVSAMMSGIMMKMGIYGILRVLTFIHTDLITIGIIIFVTGIFTALWGIFMATVQNDLKKLLAYSSMENMGIILIGIGLAIIGLGNDNITVFILGMAGSLLHTVNHAMFKSVLFMGTGSVFLSTKTRNINELGGLIKRMPITAVMFIIATIAICGLPPLNGFISEFMIYSGFFSSLSEGSSVVVSIVGVLALGIIGGMTILVFVKMFGLSFLGDPRCCKSENAEEVSTSMIIGQIIPVSAIILISFFPKRVAVSLTGVACRMFGVPALPENPVLTDALTKIPVISITIILLIAIGYIFKSGVLRKRSVAASEVWRCGFSRPTAKMQYTGESFSEIIDLVNLKKPGVKESISVPKSEIFAKPRNITIDHDDKIDKAVSGRWLKYTRRIDRSLAFMQTGKINHYILQGLIFLLIILLLTATGLI